MIQDFQDALEQGINDARAPGAALFVADAGKQIFLGAAGFAQLEPERRLANTSTVYDLASLTKVVATTTATLLLRDAGQIRLDQSAAEFLPLPSLREITLTHLLHHTAGFTNSNRFYRIVSTTDELISWYATEGIEAPPGDRYLYDDAAFILLGKIVELAAMQPFDRFCAEQIFNPLGMQDTTFNPDDTLKSRCAATERCPWRRRVVVGEVHDENAYAVGGVSGHAGLFSTASDLGRYCLALLNGELLKHETIHEMTTLGAVPSYPWQALGWEMDPWQSKTKGHLPARKAFGHSGWTGTSLWLDPDRASCVVLLSNTPHPDRRRMKNGTLRNPVHRTVARALYKDGTNAHSGLDRVLREDFEILRRKRYALLTNHAAVDQLGRGILDVLALAPADSVLVRIFAPEHGLAGTSEAGQAVASSRWKDVPVVSLYGGQRAPEPVQLADVDLFVVDLQDVGARFYTYHATMKRCLEVCEAHRIPVAVLDRPNPLGGLVLEGPVARDTSSLVCSAKIPVRHGMTMGEIATWYKKDDFRRLDLNVVRMDGWRPDLHFDALALPWVAPSPNIPTPRTALWYAGNCIFESVNLNEGRGTESPFEVVGAPWLDPARIISAIPEHLTAGAILEPVDYTPRSIPGKSTDPRYRDIPCRGIRFSITDPAVLRPFAIALAVLAAAREAHPDQFRWDGQPGFDVLLGGSETRTAIENGVPVTGILASLGSELARFNQSRPKLYAGLNP